MSLTGSGYFLYGKLFHINPLHLVHTRNGGDAVHCGLKFAHRVDGEVYGADTDVIGCFGAETSHRKMEFLRDTFHQVAEQVVSVYGCDAYTHRIEAVSAFVEIHGHDGIALLGGDADRCLAITLMNVYGTVLLLETDHFVAR